jgi:hypothetical protein
MSFEGTDLSSAAFSTAGQVKKLNSFSLVSLYFTAKQTFFNVVSCLVCVPAVLWQHYAQGVPHCLCQKWTEGRPGIYWHASNSDRPMPGPPMSGSGRVCLQGTCSIKAVHTVNIEQNVRSKAARHGK